MPAADDIMAETLLAAFRRREYYDVSRPDARPWLYGIATNLIARQRRSEARAYRALARSGTDPVAESFTDDAIRRVVALDAWPLFGESLARLKPADRDVLLLVAWADLTYEEISQALTIPVGTVRSRLHRARAQVRETLRGLDPAGEKIWQEGQHHG